MRQFSILAKMASMQRLLQNHQFGSKDKIAKNISKTKLQAHYSYFMQNKTAVKNT